MEGRPFRLHLPLLALALAVTLGLAGCPWEDTVPPEDETQEDVAPDEVTQEEAARAEALIEERCLDCHTRARIDRQDADRAGWETIIDDMVDRGARVDAEERELLARYLASRSE